VKLFEDGRVVI